MLWLYKKLQIFLPLLLIVCFGLAARASSNNDIIVANNAFGYFFSGAQQAADNMGYTANSTDGNTLLLSKITTIISLILSFIGVIFLILVIYGGITWMTASGNEKQVEKAKGIVSRATIGLIIVILAYAITFFVVNKI